MSSRVMSEDVVRYAPRRSGWALLRMWLVTAALLAAAFAISRGGVDPLLRGALYLLYGSLIALCMGLLYGLGYTLSAEGLCASAGPFRIRVRLEDVESVAPGWLKNPRTWRWGLTMKGLIIRRRGRRMGIGICPDDPEAFLRDLADRCPHLEPSDEGLSPRD